MERKDSDYFSTPEYIDYLKRNCEVLGREEGERDNTFKSPHIETVVTYSEMLGMTEGGRLLEIGCGLGRLMDILSRRFKVEISGIDVSEEASRLARERLPDAAERIRTGSAERIPFDDESFDYVLCWGVFDLTDQGKALSEMLRVLRTGGRLLVTGKNDRFQPDDEDALIAEVKSREKGIPNHYTDYDAFTEAVTRNGGTFETEHFFLRRGDFMEGRVVLGRPERFLEYCVVIRKLEQVRPVNMTIADKYSKTWKESNG